MGQRVRSMQLWTACKVTQKQSLLHSRWQMKVSNFVESILASSLWVATFTPSTP